MKETNRIEGKTALVTGAGTGLGFATAKMLSEKGWQVFGTIIPSQSPDELKRLGITPIVMDITDRGSVEDGYEYIAAQVGDKGLAALINVAGVAGIAGGVIEGVSEERPGLRATCQTHSLQIEL